MRVKIDVGRRVSRLKQGETYTKTQLHSVIGFSEKTLDRIINTMVKKEMLIRDSDNYIIKKTGKCVMSFDADVLATNPIETFITAMQENHKGDVTLQIMGLLSALTPWMRTDNMNIYATGSSSAGKTHALGTILKYIPKPYYFTVTSKSEKSIYYAVKSGYIGSNAILMFDDIDAYNKFLHNLKTLSWASDIKPSHWSVNTHKFFHIDIDKEFVFWLTSIYPINNVEIQNRFVFVNVNEDEIHKETVKDFIIKKYCFGAEAEDDTLTIHKLQDAFTLLTYILNGKKIVIPYKLDVNISNTRSIIQFLVTVKAITAFNIFKRKVVNNCIISEKSDIEMAIKLWEEFYPNSLPRHIMKTYNVLSIKNGTDKYTLANKLGISPRTVLRHINYLSERGLVGFQYKNKHTYYYKKNTHKLDIKIKSKEVKYGNKRFNWAIQGN